MPINLLASVFHPVSPQAAEITHLFIVTLIVCAIIFSVVAGLIFSSLMRFRWREGQGEREPVQNAGNRKVEIVWTVIPFLIVVLLFVMTARTMSSSDPPPLGKPDLVVTGHQWWWEANYPQSGVVTANEIHIPVGKPISVELRSADVLHEFWVSALARKMTTVPGHPNHIWLQADQPGTYLGVCTEFCGTQHAWMRFTVVAEAPAQFEVWQQAQLQPSVAPTGDAEKGLALFKAKTCASCHAIQGTGVDARVGPDLTHFASRATLGAGVAANTSENLHRWLANPQLVKPGVMMPYFQLSEVQVTDLAAYLGSLQ